MAKPPSAASILRNMKKDNRVEKKTPIASEMYLPNLSGGKRHPEMKKNFLYTDGSNANSNIDIGTYNLSTTGTGTFGDVGIGITTPETTVHVIGKGTFESATGGFSDPTTSIPFFISGSQGGMGWWDRDLSSKPNPLVKGNRYIFYVDGKVFRLYTDGVGDLLGITSDGGVGIGTITPKGKMELVSEGTTDAPFYLTSYHTTPVPSYVGRSARGTKASPTATQTNDYLFIAAGQGYTGSWSESDTGSPAVITMKAAEVHSATNQGTYMEFSTTPIGSTGAAGRAVRLQITNAGDFNFYGGDLTTTGNVKGNFQSSDGSAGITQAETAVNTFDIVIKDGLITSFTKNS